jgi:hypothetical protein
MSGFGINSELLAPYAFGSQSARKVIHGRLLIR